MGKPKKWEPKKPEAQAAPPPTDRDKRMEKLAAEVENDNPEFVAWLREKGILKGKVKK